jgi:hypothetical protein
MINNHIPATHTHQRGLRNRLYSDDKSKITLGCAAWRRRSPLRA